MFAISDQFRILIWIIVGASGIAFGALTMVLESNLRYEIRRRIPGEERRGDKPTPRARQTWLIYIFTGLISVIGTAVASSAPTLDSVSPMTGDFRVAVASFSELGKPGRKNIGKEFADGVRLRLEQDLLEINPDLILTVWGPDRVGGIDGETKEIRARNAANLADKIGADLIIYGIVDTTHPIWTVIPEFYVSGENFFEAAEIAGQYEMGSPIPLPGQGNIAGRVELGEQMSIRSQVLSKLTIGLAYYAIHQYETALQMFISTEAIEGWEDEQSKKVLYLLIGNASGKAKNYELAETYFKKSLTIDPEYARSLVGLGSVAYIQAIEPFNKSNDPTDTDIALLGVAIDRYTQALGAKNKPALSDIDVKVHFGIGQCYFMRVYSGNEVSFIPAIDEFSYVIAAYGEGKNPRVRELAAEAHARLGLIYDLSGMSTQAIREYELALTLLYDNPERLRQYQERLDSIKTREIYP